jgi:iron complex transport system ATP-binding protein
LTRSLPPSRGEVLFEGKNIWNIPPKQFARRSAVVSQTVPAVALTVEEFVLLGRIPHYGDLQFLETGADHRAADRAMREAGVEYLRDRPMSETSGGERQLAAIARALAQEPEWLFLDEPTAHLDIAHQVAVLGLLAKLNRERRLTVIAVLHDLNLASEYSRKILLMHRGCIHKMGSPEEVLKREILERVYGTPVTVGSNPVSTKPFVLPLTDGPGKGENG